MAVTVDVTFKNDLPAGTAVNADEIFKVLKKQSPVPGQAANVQLVTESTQTPEQLHARVLRDGDSYMVLMFVSAR